MANPSKAQDPAAAALSAIEEALNLSDLQPVILTPKVEAPKVEASKGDAPKVEAPKVEARPVQLTPDDRFNGPPPARGDAARPRLPSTEDSKLLVPQVNLRDTEPTLRERPSGKGRGEGASLDGQDAAVPAADRRDGAAAERPRPVATGVRPANDDQETVGAILRTLQAKTSRGPTIVAGLAAVLWIGVCVFYLYTDRANLGPGLLQMQPKTALVLLAIIGPLLFFFMTAALTRRAQEVRMTARAMLQVAARLAEPEAIATEQMVTLSQVIRREIASMGDGIERSLARAGELETLVRSEVSNIERSFGENERRVRSLIEELSSEREAIVSNAERIRGAISGAHESLSRDLDFATRNLTARVGQAGAQVMASLNGKGEELSAALVGTVGNYTGELEQKFAAVGQVLIADLGLRADDIVHRIDATGARISDEIVSRGETVAARLTEVQDRLHASNEALFAHHEDMHDRLATAANETVVALSGAVDSLHERLSAATSETSEALSAHQADMHERLSETASEAISALALHTDALQQRIGGVGNEALTAFNGHAEAMHDKLNTIAGETAAALTSHTQAMHERLTDTAQQTIEVLAEHTSNMHDRLEATTNETLGALDVHSRTLGGRLEDVARETVDGLASHADRFETRMRESSVAAVDAIDAQGKILNDRLTDVTGQTLSILDDHTATMNERLGATAEQAVGQLAAHLDGMHEQLATNAQATAEALGQHAEALQEGFVANTRQAIATLAEQVEALNARFAEITGDSIGAIGTHGTRINEALAERMAAFNETFAAHGAEATDKLGAHAERFNATLADRLGAIENTFTIQGGDINDRLGFHLQEAAQIFETQIGQFEQRAIDRTQSMASALEEMVERVDSDIEARAKAMNDALSARAGEIARTLSAGGREVTEALDAKSADIADVFTSRSALINDQLDGHVTRLNDRVIGPLSVIASTLDEKGRVLTSSLIDRVGAIDAMLTEHSTHLHDRLADIDAALGEKGQAFAIGLAARAAEIQMLFDERGTRLIENLADRGHEIVEHLSQTQAELGGALERAAVELKKTIEGDVSASLGSLAGANERLRGDLGSVIERLGATGARLQVMIGSATERFESFQATMGERIDGFGGAIHAARAEIDRINNATDKTLTDAGGIAATLAAHNRAISVSSNEMERMHADVERRLATRLAALENVFASVSTRHQNLETVVNSFSGLIEEGLRNAEQRAREIAAFLSEASQSSTGLIDEHFAAIRANSGKERDLTAVALRAAYDQAAQEVESLFDQSTRRFREAADEMRTMSRTIQEEIASTREEVRRNAVELPREASEQTSAMRRVVADQIKALNELNDIVSRAGRSLDLSLPEADPVGPRDGSRRDYDSQPALPDLRDATRREEPPRRPQPRQEKARQEAARQDMPRLDQPRPEPQRREPARRDTTREDTSRQTPARQGPVRQEPARAPARADAGRPATGARTPSGKGRRDPGQGWLSDLLARASQDEDESADVPPTRGNGRSVEPLEAITADIARMIDAEAANDAWERYRRGDDGAFDRTIYIGRGSQTFDEMRRRYAKDGDFHQTVDRYIQEFERLLAQAQMDDPDDHAVRSYLESDSGKVYTMLAHAAGRLD